MFLSSNGLFFLEICSTGGTTEEQPRWKPILFQESVIYDETSWYPKGGFSKYLERFRVGGTGKFNSMSSDKV